MKLQLKNFQTADAPVIDKQFPTVRKLFLAFMKDKATLNQEKFWIQQPDDMFVRMQG